VRRGRFRSRAAILALLGACILAPTGAAQTPFVMEMDTGGAGFSVSGTLPDPVKTAEKVLQCEPARCTQDVFEAATPVLEPEPTAPAPPATQPEPSSSPPAPSIPQPEQAPDSAATRNDSGPSSTKPARSPTRAANRQASTFEGVSAASNSAVAEAGASSLPVQERRSEPLQRRRVERHTPEAAPLRGPDLLGPPPALGLPTALEQGLDWNPLLLSMLLGATSLALLFFLIVAAPQHGLARVSYQLAGRRYDLGLIGAVTLVGVVLGYLVATWVG
jgi:hypothetical protein